MVKDIEIPEGYQNTEIGIIPYNWEIKELAMISNKIASGKSNTKSKIGEYPIYGSTGIIGFNSIYDYQGKKILIARVGANAGSLYCVDGKYLISDNTLLVEIGEEVDYSFIYFYLKYIKLNKLIFGSGQPLITGSQLKKLVVPVPSFKHEQTAIATALSDVDSLIKNLEKLIQKKRDILQGVMQELLTGRKRLEGYSGEWEVKRLGEISELYQPVTISQNQLKEQGFLVYGANGIIGKYYMYNHEHRQVIITCRGSTCGTVTKTKDKCWITGNAMVANVDKNMELDKLFFYYLLKKQDFRTCITGSGQPQIVRQPLSNFKLRIPVEIAEQKAIATKIEVFDNQLVAMEYKLHKYKTVKQGMMQVLLTGKIRLL